MRRQLVKWLERRRDRAALRAGMQVLRPRAPERDVVPAYVVTYNRLSMTRALVERIARLPGLRPIVVDNASTYPPLLEWYRACDVEVRLLADNVGHRSPWLVGIVDETRAPHYVVSDCDLDLSACPDDVLARLREGFTRYPGRNKVGLSLELDDLPPDLPELPAVLAQERPYWARPVEGGFFDAPVDTTFALYRRRGSTYRASNSLRTDRPYTARHLPWYATPATMTDEERFYRETARRDIATILRQGGDSART